MSTGSPWAASSSSAIVSSFSASVGRHRLEARLQLRVLVLGGQGLGPVQGQVEGAAAVVDLVHLARGVAGVLQVLADGLRPGSRPAAPPGRCRCCSAIMLQGRHQGAVLAQRVPAQVAFLEELLHVLGRRAAGAGLEQAAAVRAAARWRACGRWCPARGWGRGR